MLALAWMALNANSENANMLMFTIANCFWGGQRLSMFIFLLTQHTVEFAN